MTETISEQEQFDLHFKEFHVYFKKVQQQWLNSNRPYIRDVAPIAMTTSHQREKIKVTQKKWETYITPITETWWLERGYKVVWPHNNEESMKFNKIES